MPEPCAPVHNSFEQPQGGRRSSLNHKGHKEHEERRRLRTAEATTAARMTLRATRTTASRGSCRRSCCRSQSVSFFVFFVPFVVGLLLFLFGYRKKLEAAGPRSKESLGTPDPTPPAESRIPNKPPARRSPAPPPPRRLRCPAHHHPHRRPRQTVVDGFQLAHPALGGGVPVAAIQEVSVAPSRLRPVASNRVAT